MTNTEIQDIAKHICTQELGLEYQDVSEFLEEVPYILEDSHKNNHMINLTYILSLEGEEQEQAWKTVGGKFRNNKKFMTGLIRQVCIERLMPKRWKHELANAVTFLKTSVPTIDKQESKDK